MARLQCRSEKKNAVKIAIGRDMKNKTIGEMEKNKKLSSRCGSVKNNK